MSRWALVLVFACACDSDDAPSLSDIDARIFRPQCTVACHSGGEFAAGGLDMSVDVRRVLVDQPPTAVACLESPLERVVPGDPDASLLYVKVVAKISGSPAPCGGSMPLGSNKPALSADDADIIRAWIEDGAP